MNKSKLTRTLMTAVSVVALSAVAYGCSSDNGEKDSLNTQVEDLQKQLDDAQAAATAAEDAKTAAEDAKTAAEDAKTTAEADRDTALTAKGAAEEAKRTAEDAKTAAETAKMAAETEQARVQELLDAALADDTTDDTKIADLRTRIDTLNGTITDKDAEIVALTGTITDKDAEIATLNGTIAAKDTEIDDLKKQIADAATDKTTAEIVAEAKKVNTAIRKPSGTAPSRTVMATASALTVESTGYTDGGAAPGSASLPTGWRGSELNKDDNTLVVYSDVADATPTLLGIIYNSIAVKNVRMYTVDDPSVPKVGPRVDPSEIDWEDVKRDNTAVTSTTTADKTETVSFAGSVRGVSGTFSCTKDDCSVSNAPSRNSDGSANITTNGTTDGWSFIPTDPNALVNVQDDGYLSLGWWLGKNTDGSSYSFNSFAMGHGSLAADYSTKQDGAEAPEADSIDGKATYAGAAAGKYSLLDTIEDTASAGNWTATANLTADFDANVPDPIDPTKVDKHGVSLNGEITDFISGGESLANWKVTLKAIDTNANTAGIQGAPISFVAQPLLDDGPVAEWSRGGAAKGTGNWSHTFRGSAGDTNAEPGAVTGTFEASVGTRAKISGAYGATKETPAN